MNLDFEAAPSRQTWEDLATSWGGSSVFHRWNWLEAASRAGWPNPTKVVVHLDGEPSMAIPVFPRRYGPISVILSPPPSLGIEYLGPAFPVGRGDDGKGSELLKALIDWLEAEFKPSLFYTRTVPLVRDSRPFVWSGHDVRPLFTYVLRLSENLDPLFGHFDRKLRSDLRRTANRVIVRPGGADLCARVQQLVSQRYRAQGKRFGPTRSYFLDLYEGLGPGAFQPIGAYADAGLEAAAIVTVHRNRAAYWQGASRIGGARLPFTDHMIWYAIQMASERGCDEFEIVGANTPRLDAYKRKFAPSLEQFLEISKGNRTGRIAVALYGRLKRR